MNSLFVNKVGLDHMFEWRNNQDFGFINEKIKCVVDGCSEGKHSEIGAKLFCHLFEKFESVERSFDQLIQTFPSFEEQKEHLLFTILYIVEDEFNFYAHICGDGYMILQNHLDEISFIEINQNNSPSYYIYNLMPKEYLKEYKTGVSFQTHVFPKSEFKNVGVATDGIRYLLDTEYEEAFKSFLLQKNARRFSLLLNKIHQEAQLHILSNKSFDKPVFLHDDLTIAF
jgi:hypothetical protein